MNTTLPCRVCRKLFTVHESVVTRGFGKYCSRTCYNRARSRNPETRFWSRVVRGDADACWLWTGGVSNTGYGKVYVESVPWLTHRYAWVLAHGAIPEGARVRARCGNRRCVNVAHLFLAHGRSA